MTSTTVVPPTPAVPRQPRPGIDTDRVADLISQLLVELGEDPQRDGLAETPKRVAAWWTDFLSRTARRPPPASPSRSWPASWSW
ncbi:GTP cyclohydrolase I [Streptomyces sp. C8S0]|uniref:GTP cyclohydrolase I n=1 Tax=Streptomyces sp. C8S0 TaxID=2585716 RepID=UPI0021F75003|nr:GTP cyclohydrolase I [Streptomyces sp. C8S0]